MPIGTSAPLPEAIVEYLAACEAEGQSRATLGWKRAVLRRFADYAGTVAAGDVDSLTLDLARRWRSAASLTLHRDLRRVAASRGTAVDLRKQPV